jgi:hypothetical protein
MVYKVELPKPLRPKAAPKKHALPPTPTYPTGTTPDRVSTIIRETLSTIVRENHVVKGKIRPPSRSEFR